MTRWVPEWLGQAYSRLLRQFWTSWFTVADAERIGVRRPHVVLPRLAASGWLERFGRGQYRVVHPLVAIMTSFRPDWRERIPQPAYLPMLEFAVSRFWEAFGERLRAVLLFGSVARGQARGDSDVDLMVVADGMPTRYGDRVREALDMLEGWENVKLNLSERFSIYPNIDLMLLDTREADTTHPFYLDAVQEGIILYDKDEFMATRLEALRQKLEQAGAIRIQLPNGRWYWVVSPAARGVGVEV